MEHGLERFKYLITYISNMLLNKNTLGILNEFASDYSKKIYGGDVAKRLKMNQKTVCNILNGLEKEHLLQSSIEGKNKYYSLNKFNSNLKETVKLIEIGRKVDFLEKNKTIRDLFEKLEERTEGVLAIFGSYAKGNTKKSSDLDIFLIGKIKDIEDLESLYGLKINVIKADRNKFDKNEPLIKEVIQNHIILKGMEDFVGLIWE
jgi:predicted nucleotidyltransferase